jgi:hypothetical protein
MPNWVRNARNYCHEKDRLGEAFALATEYHFEATSVLATLAATGQPQEFQAAVIKAQRARRECERTRLAFDFHRLEHGC